MPNAGKKQNKTFPDAFGEFTEFRYFKKNAVILSQGKVENHISLVCKGSVGIFVEHHENEICHAFIFEDEYLSSYESFVTRKPSLLFVKALEDVTLASITHKNMQKILSSADGLLYAKQIADQLFFGSQHRVLSLITQTAEERYRLLVSKRSHVIKKIKQRYIASYLGITPVSLSRIRAHVVKSDLLSFDND